MYVFPQPYFYGNQGCNDGNGSGWFWAIIIVLFIIFFLFWGSGFNGTKNSY